jgi:predicted acylesterase/phospholipase RssA
MTSNQTDFRKDTRTQFEQIVLVLQGGGALGSYQAGVYQALAEADLQPNWVAGISIGAINSAIIAGNAPDKRVDRLREFWETVSEAPLGIPYFKSIELPNTFVHHLVNQGRAANILLFGAPSFFTPRMPPVAMWPADAPDKASHPYKDAAKTDRQKKVFSDNVTYFEKEIKWFRENFPRRKVMTLVVARCENGRIAIAADTLVSEQGRRWHSLRTLSISA